MIVARKGRLEEIFSKALYTDEDPNNYTVSYRDLDSVVEVPLPEFIKVSENFDVIPASRILLVKKNGATLFKKHGTTLR